MITSLELGLIYGIMALGVFLTFRVLRFADLTIDGSFTLGAAVAAKLIIDGVNPWLATGAAFFAGAAAGLVTGLLHTKGKIEGLLASILVMIALWSINLRVMEKSNLPLLRETTLLSGLRDDYLLGGDSWFSVGLFSIVLIIIIALLRWFLGTNYGLAMQSTGDAESMVKSFGVNTDRVKIVNLALSNGLVGLCGALIAQYQGFADISMGIGLILVGLASVILGQAVFGQRFLLQAVVAVVLGSVLYRLAIYFALRVEWVSANDMKLISAILVVLALIIPQIGIFKRVPKPNWTILQRSNAAASQNEEASNAAR